MSPIQRVTTDAGPIPRRGAAIAPLSFAQRRFWFLEHRAPGTPVHHLPIVARLTGTLDVTALADALRRVIERHEVLRTRFVLIEDEPMQHIEHEAPPMVECLDFSHE